MSNDGDYTNHQFSLFGERPIKRIPISRERIEEAKQLLQNGDHIGAAAKLRDVRERLEDYERRISNNIKND